MSYDALLFNYLLLDNPIAQNLLIKQLQRYHLEVVATNNGEEAIKGVGGFTY